MKVVKGMLVLIAVIVHYILLGYLSRQIYLLRKETFNIAKMQLERSVSMSEIFTDHLKNQNQILKSGIKNANKYMK